MESTNPSAVPDMERQSNHSIRWRVAGVAFAIASVIPSGGAHGSPESSAVELRPQPLSDQDPFALEMYDAELPDITVPVEATTSTTTSTSLIPETTTTALPEREPQPGEVIATLTAPRLCDINIDVVALSDEEIANGLIGRGPDYQSGGSHIDALIDDAPQRDCETTLGHAVNVRGGLEQPIQSKDQRGAPPYYATREERIVSGTSRPANTFRPLAGHWPGTAELGEPGVAVIFGHRTTRSASFASIDVLQLGDELSVSLSNGEELNYRVTSVEIVAEDAVYDVLNQPPPEGATSGMTLFACTPQGAATERIVVNSALVE